MKLHISEFVYLISLVIVNIKNKGKIDAKFLKAIPESSVQLGLTPGPCPNRKVSVRADLGFSRGGADFQKLLEKFDDFFLGLD